MKIVKIALVITLAIAIALYLVIVIDKINTARRVRSSSEKVYVAFGCHLIDENNNHINKTVKTVGNQFNGRFQMLVRSSQDLDFDVVLMRNYEEIEFSLDGNEKSLKHKLFVPKTLDKDKLLSFVFEISTDDIEGGLNECILVFRTKPLLYRNGEKAHVKNVNTSRFTVFNQSQHKDLKNMKYSKIWTT